MKKIALLIVTFGVLLFLSCRKEEIGDTDDLRGDWALKEVISNNGISTRENLYNLTIGKNNQGERILVGNSLLKETVYLSFHKDLGKIFVTTEYNDPNFIVFRISFMFDIVNNQYNKQIWEYNNYYQSSFGQELRTTRWILDRK
jgi:hypothetical protein